MRIRTRSYAAKAKVKAHPTRRLPRWRVLRMSATVLIQPLMRSMALRACWLLAYPGWRVVGPSMAERRRVVFWATCGVTHRGAQGADELGRVVRP